MTLSGPIERAWHPAGRRYGRGTRHYRTDAGGAPSRILQALAKREGGGTCHAPRGKRPTMGRLECLASTCTGEHGGRERAGARGMECHHSGEWGAPIGCGWHSGDGSPPSGWGAAGMGLASARGCHPMRRRRRRQDAASVLHHRPATWRQKTGNFGVARFLRLAGAHARARARRLPPKNSGENSRKNFPRIPGNSRANPLKPRDFSPSASR